MLTAIRCQTQLLAIAEKGSLTERYCLVLEELRKEAVQRSGDSQTAVCAVISTERTPRRSELIQQEILAVDTTISLEHDFDDDVIPDVAGFDATPGSSAYDISGWGTFDSMVSGNMAARNRYRNGADPC